MAVKNTTKERLKVYMAYYNEGFKDLAIALGLSYQSLNKKLNNHTDFKRKEIKIIKSRYELSGSDVDYIFFDVDDAVIEEDTTEE